MDKVKIRFYVMLCWDDWQQNGCYETIVWATGYQEAEDKCREAMAKHKAADYEKPDDADADNLNDPDWWLENYGGQWQLVNCREVEGFIQYLKGDA